MKISVKKKYVAAIAFFISISLGLLLIQQILRSISEKSFYDIAIPLVFIICTIYSVAYWKDLRDKHQTAEESAKEASKDDANRFNEIKSHLYKKSENEAYTLNYVAGKIRFTKTWSEQQAIDEMKHIPDVIKKELI